MYHSQSVDLAHNTKPIMYLFNQPWCGACKRLKQTFQDEGATVAKLSEKFILVNVGGDDNSAFGVRSHTFLDHLSPIGDA